MEDKQLTRDGKLNVSVKVKNTGKYKGTETVQLYIRDLVASVTRPVKELKSFRKVELVITEKDLRFWNDKKQFISEPGKFHLFIGTDSENVKKAEFVLL